MGRPIAYPELTHKSKTPFHDPKRLIILTAQMAYPINGENGNTEPLYRITFARCIISPCLADRQFLFTGDKYYELHRTRKPVCRLYASYLH